MAMSSSLPTRDWLSWSGTCEGNWKPKRPRNTPCIRSLEPTDSSTAPSPPNNCGVGSPSDASTPKPRCSPRAPRNGGGWRRCRSLPRTCCSPARRPSVLGPPAVAGRASNKIPAGVCGILLGALGIHKFIPGYTGAGLIMLLVSLIGGILTCGVASGVMHVIGLIEGIIYLTKTDEEFVRNYVDGRKEWF